MVEKFSNVISARDFGFLELLKLFQTAKEIKEIYKNEATRPALQYVLQKKGQSLFFRIITAPSTRTITSFEDAIRVLGGFSQTSPLEFTSWVKGETLRSLARCIGTLPDCIIIRHDKDDDAAQKFASVATDYDLRFITINAGSGKKEHPTQMIVDLFTIWERDQTKFVNGDLTYALIGDLSHSRTIHSLLLGLSHFGGTVFLVGPPEENIPPWLAQELSGTNLRIQKVINQLDIISECDYLYYTRLQENLRHKKISKEQKHLYWSLYGVTDESRGLMLRNACALNPLPADEGYPENIDLIDPRFIHYAQAENGFFTRMALLKLIFAPALDLRHAASEMGMVSVSGKLEQPFTIPIRSINAVCAGEKCQSVRLENHNWITLDPAIDEKLKKPKTICPSCLPHA